MLQPAHLRVRVGVLGLGLGSGLGLGLGVGSGVGVRVRGRGSRPTLGLGVGVGVGVGGRTFSEMIARSCDALEEKTWRGRYRGDNQVTRADPLEGAITR